MFASGSVMAWMYDLGSCAAFGRARACCTAPSFALEMMSKSILCEGTSCGLRLHSGLKVTVYIVCLLSILEVSAAVTMPGLVTPLPPPDRMDTAENRG